MWWAAAIEYYVYHLIVSFLQFPPFPHIKTAVWDHFNELLIWGSSHYNAYLFSIQIIGSVNCKHHLLIRIRIFLLPESGQHSSMKFCVSVAEFCVYCLYRTANFTVALGEDFLSLPINLFLYTCWGLSGHSWPGHAGTCQLAFDQYVSFVLHLDVPLGYQVTAQLY